MKKTFTLLFSLFISICINAQCWKVVATGGIHNLAIKDNGTLWSWGYGERGALGIDNGINSTEPIQVGTDSNWVLLCPGYGNSIAQKINGELWTWGENFEGELANGTTGGSNVPVLVNTISDVQLLSGSNSKLAIRTDSTLWGWGHNSHAELGDGTFMYKLSPVQIGNDNHWKSVSAGYGHTLAIKAGGTVWGWGTGFDQQLGNGVSGFADTPVNIMVGNDWKVVSACLYHSLAIKNNGTLWGWGYNGNGWLGDGTNISTGSPVQIGSDSTWLFITSGNGGSSFAIKTDSTLWAWGYNADGQLGDGSTTNKTSPVQIGGFTKWKFVSAGTEHTIALAHDNTLWSWGSNRWGQLGDGTNISKLFPVQIQCFSVVPVKLSFFSVRKNKDGILLNWQTEIELNSKEFQIERSTDGIIFGSIGTLRASGNVAGSSYSFLDTRPKNGYNYYRLKNIDIDGRLSYSNIKMLSFAPSLNEVYVYPNPVRDMLVIDNNFIGKNITIDITNTEGRKVWKTINGNSSRYQVQTTGWETGIYIVTITDENTTVTKKIIKQ